MGRNAAPERASGRHEPTPDARSLIEALERHLLSASGGWANRAALAEFRALAGELRSGLSDPIGRDRLDALCGWAELLYGTRRHRRWERGVDQLRRAMLAGFASLRHSLT